MNPYPFLNAGTPRPFPPSSSPRGGQRGISLFISLVTRVIITVAGIALLRSVDTGALVPGNLAFKDATMQATSVGMEEAATYLNNTVRSTGEARPLRGLGRREVGHGNLAMRSLKKVLPPDGDNPYTLRIVSDILESNGSSSMATVCAGSLVSMDAGVRTQATCSGIAMGMISDGKGKFKVLSDILGDEDHLGDMDFKVTGTKNGICACQMDLKVKGLPYEVLEDALAQAREGRLHIIGEMEKTLAHSNADYKSHAPRIIELVIARDFIGAIIGPQGKIIQEIQRETKTTISIEEKNDRGYVQIFAADKNALDAALARVNAMVAIPEVGGW